MQNLSFKKVGAGGNAYQKEKESWSGKTKEEGMAEPKSNKIWFMDNILKIETYCFTL